MRLTNWYPDYIKPVRVGVYQCLLFTGGTVYSRWDGCFWSTLAASIENAAAQKNRSFYQNRVWRGVAK